MSAYIMKDQGLNRALVQEFDTSSTSNIGVFYGFRKMFWKYLTKLHVGFYDACCVEAGTAGYTGVRFNNTTGQTEFYDPYSKSWIATGSWAATTTTTTAALTTTTTAAPTTTTTTAALTTTTTAAPTTTTTTTPSDIRLKTNIQLTGNRVGRLREYSWDWNDVAKELNLTSYPTVGVLAQEALVIYPEFVTFDTIIGYYRVNLEGIKGN